MQSHPHHPTSSRVQRHQRSDDLCSNVYYGDYGADGHSFGGGVGTCCSDSLVTALEAEASTSSFVLDYLVAGADDMNFINNKEISAGGRGVGGYRSAAGCFTVGGRRVHFSNSDGGGDDVSLYGTPKEEARNHAGNILERLNAHWLSSSPLCIMYNI
jgi:hypothetical protein